ncbi:MAG: DUF1772 domain-containing protein [Hamadaea sp.]|nr:DUF1772 domain-containing protein [Hamadaea sp.]
MTTFDSIVLVAAATLAALTGGLMFSFAVAQMPGLRHVDDRAYVAVVQSVNLRIVNPVFMVAFLGPILLLPLATFLTRDTGAFGWLLAASILYVVGPFGVTVAGNIPLNDRLAKIDVAAASDAELSEARGWFEAPWGRRHLVRTVLAVAVVALTFVAALRA